MMTLAEVLALHPGDGATAEALAAGVTAAEAKRNEMVGLAAEAERVRTSGLLTIDDKKLQVSERDASQARLAAERIGELLPKLKTDLGAARGRETVAELQAMVPGVIELDAALMAWWAREWTKMLPIATAGMQAFNAAHEAREEFLAKVESAFRSQDVRNAAPDGLGVQVPPKRDNPGLLFMM